MYVVLLSGWRGVGKDQLGAVLCERYGYRRYAFADMLKDYCAKRFFVPRALFDDRVKKEQPVLGGLSPRDLCVREARSLRVRDDAFFARLLLQRLALERPDRVVITDWRYPVERETLAASSAVRGIFSVRLCWPTNLCDNPSAPPPPTDVDEHLLDAASFDLSLATPLNFSDALAKMRTYQPDFFVA